MVSPFMHSAIWQSVRIRCPRRTQSRFSLFSPDGSGRLGVLTDTGSLTTHMLDVLTACDALVLECNHDREMLACSDYPVVLKTSFRASRTSGQRYRRRLVETDRRQSLQHIVAAHLRTEQLR